MQLYDNNDGARERLIIVGLKQFALHGITGVRTRTLAEEAGVNQSAIPYYFGGKEGLYHTILAEVSGKLKQKIDERGLTNITNVRTIDDAKRHLSSLIYNHTLTILSLDVGIDWAILVVRELLQPTKGFDTIFSTIIGPIHKMMCYLIAMIQNKDEQDISVIIAAQAVIGQTLSFVTAREVFLRRSGVCLEPNLIKTIADQLSTMAVLAIDIH